ncbi:MAG: peptidoglycan-binding protein [Acidobacteriota bacterium]
MVLRRGSTGEAVRVLQRRLEDRNFPPGLIDGDFGPATEAAVRAFQASEGLLVDGVVGRFTLAALDLADAIDGEPPYDLSLVTPRLVSEIVLFEHVGTIQRNLPAILEALEAFDLATRDLVAMALGTIVAEVGGLEPIAERTSRFNTSPQGHPFDLYDFRTDLGNGARGDGARFRGRGYVQLTGRDNYARFGRRIGLGDALLDDPDRANEPDIAARLLAAFLAEHRVRILDALRRDDLRTARRAVNGGTHGLDRFSDAFRRARRVLPPEAETGG